MAHFAQIWQSHRTATLLVLLGLVSGAITACGGADNSTSTSQSTSSSTAGSLTKAKAKTVTVGETGFGVSPNSFPGSPQYLWAVAIVNNGTDEVVGPNVSFSAYDSSGKVIGQSTATTPILRAGMEFPFGAQVEVPAEAKVDKVVATLSNDSYGKDPNSNSRFTAEGVHFQPGSYGGSGAVLGEIVSGYKQDVKHIYVSVVCYDGAKKIIGGGDTYVESIASGQKVGFSTPILYVSAAPTSCSAAATITFGSESSG